MVNSFDHCKTSVARYLRIVRIARRCWSVPRKDCRASLERQPRAAAVPTWARRGLETPLQVLNAPPDARIAARCRREYDLDAPEFFGGDSFSRLRSLLHTMPRPGTPANRNQSS